MQLLSSAFSHQDSIPSQYTAQGEDISPPLMWQGVPEGVRSFALICDDPDAPQGTYTHWILYNIPAGMKDLPEAFKLSSTGIKGLRNSAGIRDYAGPNPPSGNHRYFFTLYALDAVIELPEGATKADLLKAIKGHVLSEAVLLGYYSKS